MNQLWSWLLTGIGVTGFYLVSRGLWWGWAFNLGVQGLWLAYSISTRQWGFLVSALVYSWVFRRNLIVTYRKGRRAEGRESA